MNLARFFIIAFVCGAPLLCGSYRLHAQDGMGPAPYVILRPMPCQVRSLSSSTYADRELASPHRSRPNSAPDEWEHTGPAQSSTPEATVIAFPWTSSNTVQPRRYSATDRDDAPNRISAVPTHARRIHPKSATDGTVSPPNLVLPAPMKQHGASCDSWADRGDCGRGIYATYRLPYAYGWFGAGGGQRYRARSFGYYGNYDRWTFE